MIGIEIMRYTAYGNLFEKRGVNQMNKDLRKQNIRYDSE